MQIRKIYNSNVYLDGTNSLLGRASEITLPEITPMTDEHTAQGMFGTIELVSGLEALGMKIKWNGFYGDRVLAAGNPFRPHKIQVRADVEVHDGGVLIGHEPLIVLSTVKWKKAPMGAFVPQTNPEFEDELSCTYFKMCLAGKDLLEIDVVNQIWLVEGKDLWVDVRKNLGL